MTNTRKSVSQKKQISKLSNGIKESKPAHHGKKPKADLKRSHVQTETVNDETKQSVESRPFVIPPPSPKKRATVNYATRESNDYQVFSPAVSLYSFT